VRAVMPEFFSQRRIRAMRDVFHEIDVDEGLNLDQEELAPFYEYVFYKLFDVNLTRAEQQQVNRTRAWVVRMNGDSYPSDNHYNDHHGGSNRRRDENLTSHMLLSQVYEAYLLKRFLSFADSLLLHLVFRSASMPTRSS